MSTTAPAQPAAPADPNQPGGTGTPPAPAPAPAPPAPPAGAPDLKTLTGDQLAAVLENPALWQQPRIVELLNGSKELKALKKTQSDAEAAALTEQGKFKELADKTAAENTTLQGQIKTSTINQALTAKLFTMGVVDLDAAIQLVDRSKVDVDDNGNVTGVDTALEALKTGKAYLFNGQPGVKPPVGNPTNPGNGNQPTGVGKFKRSQLADREFYNANRTEIVKAIALGQIENDIA